MIAVLCFTAFALPLLGVMSVAVIKDRAQSTLMWGLAADAITIL